MGFQREGQPVRQKQTAHVAGVFDGKQISLFVDGILIDAQPVPADFPFKGKRSFDRI